MDKFIKGLKIKKHTVYNMEVFHENNIYIPSRTIYFGSSEPGFDMDTVNAFTVGQTIKNLHVLDKINSKPITLLLNTPGGNWEDGMAVYDIIKTLKSRVTIIGMGKIYSMGSIIMQAGHTRLMTENAYMMIHDGSDAYDGNTKSFEAWASHSKITRYKMYNIYFDKMKVKNKKITLEKIELMCAHDKIFTADEAVKVGLADMIGG